MLSNIDSFEITLEHDIDEQYQYAPGEILRGYVTIKCSKSVKVKSLFIQIKGDANVSWNIPRKRRIEEYSARETYINVMKSLIDTSPYASGVEMLSHGTHDFPFQYQLPYSLPSSFIGKYGSITYIVKATLQGDNKLGVTSPLINSEPFLVLRRLDLSKETTLMNPYKMGRSQRVIGLFCCSSGSLDVSFEVNRQVHLPGEDISMACTVSNDSPRLVTALQANINMISTFFAKNHVMVNQQTVNKKRDDWEMDTGEGRKWNDVRLTIPPYIPESRLEGCDIIETRYELQFLIEIKGRNPMEIVVPLLIGTDGIDEEELNQTIEATDKPIDRKFTSKSAPMTMWRPIDAEVTNNYSNGDVPHHMTGDENDNNKDLLHKLPIQDVSSDPDFEDLQLADFNYNEHNKFGSVFGVGDLRRNPLYSSQLYSHKPVHVVNDEWIENDDEEENTRL